MDEVARIRIGDARGGNSRSMDAQRWGALIGGSALAIYGITRRSPLGVALATGGGAIALLGSTQKTRSQSTSAWTSVLINCSPQEAYKFWRGLENLPRFMNRLHSVTVLDNRRSQWVAIGPIGREIRWEAEITEERENEYIAWRSLPGSDVEVDGRVEFREAPADRGTLISARMQFRAVAGKGSAFANSLNKAASFAMRQDLRRLAALMESGEIPTTEGQSHGARDFVTGVMRLADPTRPIRPGSQLKEVYETRKGIA